LQIPHVYVTFSSPACRVLHRIALPGVSAIVSTIYRHLFHIHTRASLCGFLGRCSSVEDLPPPNELRRLLDYAFCE
jgi:hypothetical protein